MSWKGDCWNNVEIESFLSSLKTERSSRWNYATRDQVRADVFDYIERSYNPRRRHSTLGCVCPDQFEQARMSLRYCPRKRPKPRTGVRHDRALGSCGSAVHARRANLSNPSGSNRSDVLAELSSDTPHGTVSAVRRTRQPFARAGVGRVGSPEARARCDPKRSFGDARNQSEILRVRQSVTGRLNERRLLANSAHFCPVPTPRPVPPRRLRCSGVSTQAELKDCLANPS